MSGQIVHKYALLQNYPQMAKETSVYAVTQLLVSGMN
jgi:hypothetical protein